jgi:hypothetical protein
MNYLAPGITSDKYDPSQSLDVFYGRTVGWILEPAKKLLELPDTGIPVLMLAASVIQPMGGVQKRGNNKREFCEGFRYIFPKVPGDSESGSVAEEACELLRNGLYHEAFIKPGLFIRDQNDPVVRESGILYVDPKKFLTVVTEAFTRLCEEIKHDGTKRKTFEEYLAVKDDEVASKRKAPIDPGVYKDIALTTGSNHSAATAIPPTSPGRLPPFRTKPK